MISRLKQLWLSYRGDICFWILVLFIIRLVGITNPPLEMSHSWRQSLTAMIAQNFYDLGANLLYPRIDMGGIREGIIGSEFPLFNYLIFLMAKAFGYTHWYGRIINLVVSSFGLVYFHKGLSRLFTRNIAFYATMLLAVSVWFGFSRKIMPDTFSVSLGIIGLYYGLSYLQDREPKQLFWFFTWSTLGILCKIPTLSLFAVLVVTMVYQGKSWKYNFRLYVVFAVGLALVWLWYFYWVPHLVNTYHYQLFFPRNFTVGWQEIRTVLPELLEKFYFVAFSSFIGFFCFLGGVFLLVKRVKAEGLLVFGFTSTFLVFCIFILKTGIVFPLHSYYIIPFVPVMAVVAGYFLGNINPKYAMILLAFVCLESIANQQDDMFIKDRELYKLTLTEIVDEYIPKDSLVVLNTTPSPQQIYFANRRGWSENAETLLRPGYIDSLDELGASFLIWDKKYEVFPSKGKVVFAGKHYIISQLD